jgi:hypothetical protein
MQDSLSLEEELIKIIRINNARVDLYFDAMKPITDIRNKNILTFFKAVKYINQLENIDENNKEKFLNLESELGKSIQSGMKHNLEKVKTV